MFIKYVLNFKSTRVEGCVFPVQGNLLVASEGMPVRVREELGTYLARQIG